MRGMRLGVILLALLAPSHPAAAVEPGTKHVALPAALGLVAEDVRFPAGDSVQVSGWWFQGPKDAAIVVVASRGTGTMADMLPAVRELQARGFGVLSFDYRGFGPGNGPEAADSLKYVMFSSQWVEDMLGALRYARSRGGRHVFAWGQDLGGAVALAAAARERVSCDGVAVEGLFRTSQEFLLMNGTASVPGVTDIHRRLVQGSDEPTSAASRLMVPLLAVLAGKDDVTPAAVTKLVAGRAPVRWDVWAIPEAKHFGAEQTPGYFNKIAQWFKQWMAFPPAGRQPEGG